MLGFIDKLARTKLSHIVVFALVCSIIRFAIAGYLANTPRHLRTGVFSFAKFTNELMDALVYASVFVFLVIRPFAIQTFYIPSGSMIQTLQIQDYIVANKWIYRWREPQHGEIVVFKPPQRALRPGEEGTDFIKRVIGLPGDVIEIKNNVLYRDGKPVDEPYKVFTRMDHADPRKFYNLTPEEMANYPVIDFKLVNDNGKYIPLNIRGDDVNYPGTGLSADEYSVSDPVDMARLKTLPAAKIPNGYLLMMGDNRNGSFDSRGWGLVKREDVIGRSEFIFVPFNRWRMTR